MNDTGTGQIQVTGLRELHRALKQMDAELPKELKGRMKAIADRVASIVRGRLPSVSGTMRRKTKAQANARGAGISWRGVIYAAPVEFGGWPKGRPYVQAGRYIYPTVDAERSQIEDEVAAVMDHYLTRAGLQ